MSLCADRFRRREAQALLMSQFDANDPDVESVQCAVCEQWIRGGKWFARMACGPRTVALCCPLCAETFERNPHPYLRRIETLSGPLPPQ
ncbi:MAG TPA: hypothetical protein VNO52_17110 [Methylomirabilota bacterium]|nr:hypothetical protein [Methylomirabilota bacterium]